MYFLQDADGASWGGTGGAHAGGSLMPLDLVSRLRLSLEPFPAPAFEAIPCACLWSHSPRLSLEPFPAPALVSALRGAGGLALTGGAGGGR